MYIFVWSVQEERMNEGRQRWQGMQCVLTVVSFFSRKILKRKTMRENVDGVMGW